MKNNKGLSLTELLVASILIGVVMTGVMGFNYALQSIEQTTDVNAKATINAASIISFLRRDTLLAVGNITAPGVLFFSNNTPNFASICMRQDVSDTPLNYADDNWICYAHDATFVLSRCVHRIIGDYLIDNQIACTTMAQCCTQSSEELELGALDPVPYDLSIGDAFYTITGNIDRINININTIEGNAAGGPLDFSAVNFSTSINPPMHSNL